ncbi:unnamed protein product [Sphenostylis stenocarpa]|uniref:VQ domain-containing protein n=1 Tax=Sphenostylis stenocarpa TaxID=92480 RepID=A0AA86SHJ2_9FABA|nr:unnamed protein product [Sphenostylis stenocarpa]
MLGVNNHVVMMKRKGQSKRGHKKDVKVTYISSPMMVKTSASNFRALVQELTGQASNVADMFVEADYYCCDGVHDDGVQKGTNIQPLSYTSDAYFSESAWLKSHDDHYSHLHSRSSMELLNELLSFES